MKKIVIILLSAFIISGCKSILDKEINPKSFNDDFKKIETKYQKEYTKGDFEKFKDRTGNKFIASVFGVNSNEKITYRSILDTIKSERLRYEFGMNNYNNALKKMQDEIEIRVSEKQYSKGSYDFEGKFGMLYTIKNNSSKKIEALKGILKVYDLMDNELYGVYINQSKTMLPKDSVEFGEWFKVPYGNGNDLLLSKTSIDKLKFVFFPETFIFSDGTKEQIPDKPSDI